MKAFFTAPLFFGLVLVACGGATEPAPDSTGSEIIAANPPTSSTTPTNPATPTSAEVCDAQPAPNWRCASPCPYGFKGAAGTYSCECCAEAAADAGPAEVCGGPPPNARCMACPGGGNGYKQIDGKPTCECCSN